MIRVRHKALWVHRRFRELRMILRGLADPNHPVLVHLIPIRRCNLACTYCNEFDDFSDPVPLSELYRRIDRLADLRARIITMSGGEPLLHPELEAAIRRVRSHGIISSMITNGLLLTVERIQQLNDAGLEYLQISIDNVRPDETSKKSLKVLDKKLHLLARHADFAVNINSVVGGGVANPKDAYVIAERAQQLGFTSTVGIIHDSTGQLQPLSDLEQTIYRKIKALGHRSYSRLTHFQDNIVQGKTNNWNCRAGGRYLYVCEDGLVHYCSQQRGQPGIPLEHYTSDHIRQAYLTQKSCAPRCTISCVHKVSLIDFWRDPQVLQQPTRPALEPEALVQLRTAAD